MEEEKNEVGEPIIFNTCTECQTSNPIGRKSCQVCGGMCEEKFLGFREKGKKKPEGNFVPL